MASKNPPQCDILLFLATSSEVTGLQRAAAELSIPFPAKKMRIGDFVDLGLIGTDRVVAVRTEMGPFQYGGSASRSLYYLSATQATAVIGIGTAFGVDERKQSLLDILVSTGVLPYDYRTVGDRLWGFFHRTSYSDVRRAPAKESLVALFTQVAQTWSGPEKVHVGLFLSGGARIHSRKFRNELTQRCGLGHQDAIVGGDMEGVGFLAGSEPESPNWILVKAISDFADANRHAVIAQTREPAAYTSARFVLTALATRGATHVQHGRLLP